MDQIATNPEVGLDDKKDMIELLRRFENQSAEEEGGGLDLEHDYDEDELETRLRGIDLGTIALNPCAVL